MADTTSSDRLGRSGAETPVDRLLTAIGYPDRAPRGALLFTLLVDGAEIVASVEGGSLRLTCRLAGDSAQLPRLAEYAAGRMLREDAVLACDPSGAFLWRDFNGGADRRTLRRGFEDFADSCDWWRARLEPRSENEESSSFPEMTIRP